MKSYQMPVRSPRIEAGADISSPSISMPDGRSGMSVRSVGVKEIIELNWV